MKVNLHITKNEDGSLDVTGTIDELDTLANEKRTYKRWTSEEDQELEFMINDDLSAEEIAQFLNRTVSSVKNRISITGMERRKELREMYAKLKAM